MKTSRSHESGLKAHGDGGAQGCFASDDIRARGRLPMGVPHHGRNSPGPQSRSLFEAFSRPPPSVSCANTRRGVAGATSALAAPAHGLRRVPALALVSANGQDRDTLPAFENGEETGASLRLTVFDGAFTAGCAQTDAACNRLRRRRALVASVSAPGRPKSQPRRVGQHREQQPCCHAVPDAFGDQRDDQADQCRNGYEGRRCPDVMGGARMAFHSAGSPSALARLG